MVRGGKRENAGRKPDLLGANSIKLFARVPEELEKDIEKYGEGESKSEKVRFLIEKGIETIRKEKE